MSRALLNLGALCAKRSANVSSSRHGVRAENFHNKSFLGVDDAVVAFWHFSLTLSEINILKHSRRILRKLERGMTLAIAVFLCCPHVQSVAILFGKI